VAYLGFGKREDHGERGCKPIMGSGDGAFNGAVWVQGLEPTEAETLLAFERLMEAAILPTFLKIFTFSPNRRHRTLPPPLNMPLKLRVAVQTISLVMPIG